MIPGQPQPQRFVHMSTPGVKQTSAGSKPGVAQTSASSTPGVKQTSASSTPDDVGSLTIFISGLFVLLLILSFGLIDISSGYLAKKELLHIGEAAIAHAAHSLSADRYYAGDLTEQKLQSGGSTFRVPIDCEKAQSTFYTEVSGLNLRGSQIRVASWLCQNDALEATLASSISMPLQFPLLKSAVKDPVSITATVGATSLYRVS